jgi:dihydroorotase
MTALGTEPFDLVVRGGRVIDPAQGVDSILDVGVRHGRVVDVGADLSDGVAPGRIEYPPSTGTAVIDATGCLVTPGLFDLHAHVYTGVCPLTVSADETSAVSGVTTVASAGDAGAHTIEGLRRLVVDQSRTRVLAFVHIATIGLTGWPEGEATNLAYLDVEKAVRAVVENRDFVVGIKVREQAPLIVDDHGLEPVRRAAEAGRQTGVPVMVHIGDAPTSLGELMDLLSPGDIVTHCYTPMANGVLEGGRLAEAVRMARQRGIVFDVGHGFGSFAYPVVERAVAEGFWPDTISTDLHSMSANGPARDLPTTMSKFLALGMPLVEVVRAVTARPADVIGRSATIGSLRPGGVADIAVMALVPSRDKMVDAAGNSRTVDERFEVRATVRAGIPWFVPPPHPGRAGGGRGFLDR